MNELKIPFFKRVIMAIKDFEKYMEFAASKASDVILYSFKLLIIFTMFLAIISIYNMSKDVKNIYNYIDSQISYIDYDGKSLQVENKNNEPIIIQNSLIDKFIVDTTWDKQKQDKYISEIQKVSNGIVFLNDRIVIKPIDSNSMVVSYSYKEISDKYNINKIDKNILLEQISGINIVKIYLIVFGLSFISNFIVCLINFIMYVFLIGAIGYLSSIILRIRIKYNAICKMVAYSLTLPIILNIVYAIFNAFTGYEIEYFDIIYVAISYIYVIAAILIIKTDVIKKGEELQEIIKEQERIRQELERKKLEEEEAARKKKEEEEKKRKEEKEKKKKEKEDKKDDAEPQGDNA